MADGGDHGAGGGNGGSSGGTGAAGAAPVPSKWWYVGHLFFWVITGLVVYILYKDTNKEAARKHLIVSLVLGVVAAIVVIAVLVAVEMAMCASDPSWCEYDDDW